MMAVLYGRKGGPSEHVQEGWWPLETQRKHVGPIRGIKIKYFSGNHWAVLHRRVLSGLGFLHAYLSMWGVLYASGLEIRLHTEEQGCNSLCVWRCIQRTTFQAKSRWEFQSPWPSFGVNSALRTVARPEFGNRPQRSCGAVLCARGALDNFIALSHPGCTCPVYYGLREWHLTIGIYAAGSSLRGSCLCKASVTLGNQARCSLAYGW